MPNYELIGEITYGRIMTIVSALSLLGILIVDMFAIYMILTGWRK